jgi:hypothetical protein
MIRLRKGRPPAVLVNHGARWRAEYLQRLNDGDQRQRIPAQYRHPAIKQALLAEGFGKCMYCEARITHSQFGDIDHIMPLSQRPDLVVAWPNLGPSCQICNNNKHDYHDERLPIVNPYAEDPAEFLTFAGPLAVHHPGNARGQLTIACLDLNRPDLVAHRIERLRQLMPLIDEIALMPPGAARSVMIDGLARYMAPASEYSAAVTARLTPFLSSVHVLGARDGR